MACKAERLEKMRCVQRATGMQRLAAVVMAGVRVAGVCHGLVCVCVCVTPPVNFCFIVFFPPAAGPVFPPHTGKGRGRGFETDLNLSVHLLHQF